jgi:predicted permease
LIHTIMLKSLPVADPASLYRIGDNTDSCCVEGDMQDNWDIFSYSLYRRFQASAPQFEQMAAFQAGQWSYSVRRSQSDNESRSMRGEFVSGNYFQTFGVGAFVGRMLLPSDDQPSVAPAAMLSYRAWQQEWGSNSNIVGSTIVIEGHPFTVVGIAPPGFFGETLSSYPPLFWIPLQQEPMVTGTRGSLLKQTSSAWLRIIGRLKPGATIAGTSEQLTGVLRQWLPNESGMPVDFLTKSKNGIDKQFVHVIPAGAGVGAMKSDYGDSLRILLIVCSLVLLIACANIANLLLARGMARRAQTSVQLALGASRQRLIRQSLTESVLLGLLGGVAGAGIAYLGTRLMVNLAFRGVNVTTIDASPSLPVLAFCFALSLVTGVLFGTAPAWFTSHADPAEALRGVNRATRDSSALPQKTLVILQATFSVVLLAGAGLLTRSLSNQEHQDFGFAIKDRISVMLNAISTGYTPERLDAMYRELQDRLAHLPGVRSASLALYGPYYDNWGEMVVKQGETALRNDDEHGTSLDRVSPTYLDTMGQHIMRGRGITEQDNSTSRNIAVVNETFVHRFYKNEDPIGKHFGFDYPAHSSDLEIVGVMRDAKYRHPMEPPRPMVFMPLAQHLNFTEPQSKMFDPRTHLIEGALLWTSEDTGRLEPLIRKVFADIDPNFSIIGIQTMRQQVDAVFDQQRAIAQLAGLFGILALVLAAIGLYGVTTYTVARRTSEIGIRMALGADRMNVVKLVLRGAFTQVAIGLAIGIPVAMIAGRLMASKLYQVKSWDPIVLLAAIAALATAAFIASVIPAQRAASIEPVKALRTE